LREVDGRPLLGYLLERLRRCREIAQTVVATSTDVSDDAVARYCEAQATRLYRGPLEDVLGRFVEVAESLDASALVRVSGDSPLMDPAIVDRAVSLYAAEGADLVTNVQVRSFPKGQSVEVISVDALRRAASQTDDAEDREHVTRYFYRHPEQFRITKLQARRRCGRYPAIGRHPGGLPDVRANSRGHGAAAGGIWTR
jgi:spore coat polysaccharide biosynthesis protein SpsF